VWRYLRDPTFSCFDTIPECVGHTHTHTHTHRQTDTLQRHIPRLARRRAVKIRCRHEGPTSTDGINGETRIRISAGKDA